MKYVALAGAALIVIVAAVWYLFQSPGSSRNQNVAISPNQPAAPSGMVYVPGGTSVMGSDNDQNPEETPPHSVNVKPFYIDKEPVTEAQYAGFLQKTGGGRRTFSDSQAAWPATNVSEEDALAYCAGVVASGRLPNEAEWEFAARGTDGRRYPWGNSFSPALVDSSEAGLGRPESVGAHPDAASPFGVFDMAGNVWEWCSDDYRPYPGNTASMRIPPDAKVVRGGSFKSHQGYVTTTARNFDHASTRSPLIGFRCAKSP